MDVSGTYITYIYIYINEPLGNSVCLRDRTCDGEWVSGFRDPLKNGWKSDQPNYGIKLGHKANRVQPNLPHLSKDQALPTWRDHFHGSSMATK